MTTITQTRFGALRDGREALLFTLDNGVLQAKITNMGAAVVSLFTPDRDGNRDDVVLGLSTPQEYLDQVNTSMGEVMGRYVNRIANARFTLDGKTYELSKNFMGRHCIHGGESGFERKLWRAEAAEGRLTLGYHSSDGEEGFPGNLETRVTFSLEDNALRVDFEADTDADTIVNLAIQNYFNLGGHGSGSIERHELKLYADRFAETDGEFLPTGRLLETAGTPLDFREPTPIGARINMDDPQLRMTGGYDHSWEIRRQTSRLAPAAELYCPQSGRLLRLSTTKPGIQVYTGNGLDGTLIGKAGTVYQKRAGVCLIPQYFPDSPNQPRFHSPVLRRGEHYHHTTVYEFSVT